MKKLFYLFSLIGAFLVLGRTSLFADGLNSIYTSDGVYIVAAGDNGNILRSQNGGDSWNKSTAGSTNFKSVYIFGTDVWITSGNGVVYKSSTSSTSLTPYPSGVSTSVNSIYFVNGNVGYLCGDNGVIMTTANGGATWTPSNSGIANVRLNAISFKDAMNGIVAGDNGTVYVTDNGGTSWTPAALSTTRNLLDAKYFSDGIAVCGEWGTLFTKTTSGSWTQIGTRIRSDIRSISGSSITDVHVCGGGGFIRNNNNSSVDFLNFEKNPMLANLVDIVYAGGKGFAVSSLNNAVIRTTNSGMSWTMPSGTSVSYTWEAKPGASGSFLGNNICLHPTDRNVVFQAFGNQVYRSANKGETWTSIGTQTPSGNTPHSFYVSPVDTNIWLIATESGPDKVYRTTNYGQSWTEVISQNFTSYGQPLEMDQNNPHVFYFAPDNGGFYKSSDDGATFHLISNYNFRSPCDILVMWDNSDVIFLADGITGSGQATLFKSTDMGLNWTLVRTNASSSEIPSMCNSIFDKSTFFTTEWPGSNIYKTTNFGDNWFVDHTTTFSGWGSDIAHEDPSVIITGSWSNKATMTLDGGDTWVDISSGLSGHGGGILSPERGYIIAQQGSSFYKLKTTYTVITSVGENVISSVPKEFNLSQNYPNPFNPSTKINFDLPKSGSVTLKVYNQLGKEVSTLASGYRNAGSYEITFNASSLSSGIYFYKLEAEGISTTKKMLLVK